MEPLMHIFTSAILLSLFAGALGMATIKDCNFGHLAAAITGIATGVETAVLTSNACIVPFATAHVLISGSINLTCGSGAGQSAQLKLYRGSSISGTLVWTSDNFTTTAGTKMAIPFNFQEDLSNPAGVQYTLSITTTNNTGADTVDFAEMEVKVL